MTSPELRRDLDLLTKTTPEPRFSVGDPVTFWIRLDGRKPPFKAKKAGLVTVIHQPNPELSREFYYSVFTIEDNPATYSKYESALTLIEGVADNGGVE